VYFRTPADSLGITIGCGRLTDTNQEMARQDRWVECSRCGGFTAVGAVPQPSCLGDYCSNSDSLPILVPLL